MLFSGGAGLRPMVTRRPRRFPSQRPLDLSHVVRAWPPFLKREETALAFSSLFSWAFHLAGDALDLRHDAERILAQNLSDVGFAVAPA